MRALVSVGLLGLVGCKPEPPCVNDEGDEVPFCELEVAGEAEPLIYCPGQHWGAADGCNSCGCDGDGQIVCTTITTCTPAE